MKRGRPTRYRPEFARRARSYCRLGAEIQDLAGFFSVSTATLYRWLDRYPEFGLAVAMGQGERAGLLPPSMFKRATGYIYRAERIFRPNSSNPQAADYDYPVHSNVAVALRWLRIRQPDKWCAKPNPKE
jgi:transposase-like protein